MVCWWIPALPCLAIGLSRPRTSGHSQLQIRMTLGGSRSSWERHLCDSRPHRLPLPPQIPPSHHPKHQTDIHLTFQLPHMLNYSAHGFGVSCVLVFGHFGYTQNDWPLSHPLLAAPSLPVHKSVSISMAYPFRHHSGHQIHRKLSSGRMLCNKSVPTGRRHLNGSPMS